jgi:hypothetical protein
VDEAHCANKRTDLWNYYSNKCNSYRAITKSLCTWWLQHKKKKKSKNILILSNPIFLPPAYSPALIYFGRERGWWITCNYPSFKREKQKKYNLRYLLAKVRTTRGKASGTGKS